MAVTPTKLFRKKDEESSAKDTSASPDGSMHLHSTSGQSASGHGESGQGQGVPSDSGAGGLGGSQSRGFLGHCGLSQPMEVTYATSEADLLEKLVQLVRRVDPDFLVGYEVTMMSWGYLIERGDVFNMNLRKALSRVPDPPGASPSSSSGSGSSSPSPLHVVGRIVLNVWRLMRHEVALNVYTFENVTFHVLHERVPLFPFHSLTSWYEHRTRLYRYRVVDHYGYRCHANVQLLEKFNLIGRISEFARLYGIEFENVIARGTQYRVESMLLRLAKPMNFVAVSPSVQQRARMAAPECLPLILEPESRYYSDPVLVLDFQSLYPSMMIGHNYCFSTCLGRVKNLASDGKFSIGTNSMSVPVGLLKKLKDHVTISPNGVVFVKPHIRKGIMSRMVEEILNTRIMVKQSMKLHRTQKALQRLLDARQLGLKMIANVTYGYAAANFSGRMPCVEVADSIVQKGRETLEEAIKLVNSTPEWGGRVVYGDTDSLFVLFEGASREEAFRIGREIVERVTSLNPKPIKLKLEKVYQPCILQTKKRYVGFKYESPEQAEPVFDAKGIETVRRDSCPAVAKILEKSLKLLFGTQDVSVVKSYVQRQCSKLLDGRTSLLREYTFAKEYRGRESYRPGACVPALQLTLQGLSVDRRSEPRQGERVPYVIVYGSPGQPLINLVKRPEEVLSNPSLRLNGVYYVTKQILPALDRSFSLLGVDVRQWYSELPRLFRVEPQVLFGEDNSRKGTIDQYFGTMQCPICSQLTVDGICSPCKSEPQATSVILANRLHQVESSYHTLSKVCQRCVGSTDVHYHSCCVSLDCPHLHRMQSAQWQLRQTNTLNQLLHKSLSPDLLSW